MYVNNENGIKLFIIRSTKIPITCPGNSIKLILVILLVTYNNIISKRLECLYVKQNVAGSIPALGTPIDDSTNVKFESRLYDCYKSVCDLILPA